VSAPDDSWPMIEEAVFRLFDELAAKNAGEHVAVGPPLQELGWSDIESEYPIEASQLLFRANGRSLAHTDCLDAVLLAELGGLLTEPVDGVVLPGPLDGWRPGSEGDRVTGMILGPLDTSRRFAVPVCGPTGTVSLGVVEAASLTGTRLDTFDATSHWTLVDGALQGPSVDASTEWTQAITAAQRALAAELIAIAGEALRIAVEHVSVRHQFGVPIGSFQSPRHLLAAAKADLEGARALTDEAWKSSTALSAQAAKIAAGRAHRVVSDAAMQVCGAIGLTHEHDLHRYVARGFQVDSLCGSYQQLESSLAEHLFDSYSPGHAVPAIVGLGD
jgi:hypothetical protein